MSEYLAPGVYIEEIDIGSRPIEGVSTSTAGFLGLTERGPITPQLVTSFNEYQRLFGGYIKNRYLTYGVEGFFRNGGARCFVGRIVGNSAQTAGNESDTARIITIMALGPGTWGNRIAIGVKKASLDESGSKLFQLKISYWKDGITLDPDPTKNPAADIIEIYDNLSSDPISSDYYEKRINGISSLIKLEHKEDGMPTIPQVYSETYLAGGTDVDPTTTDFEGSRTENGNPTGLAGFEEIDEISIVCVPDEDENAYPGLRSSIISHCENMKDRFAILQTPQSAGPVKDLWPPLDSKCAAFYYPWISVLDPVLNSYTLVPPGGHVAGIYSRTDQERGVHKAPANEVVRGANSLQLNITKGEQEILNPRGVNCIRSFPGRGIRIWGARTTSSDPKWKYVNVRRLFLYLEESIEEGTQWVVFEPNNEKLWAKVRQTVEEFLTRIWRDGALMGTTRDEAFFVRCDRTTMTQDDINNGRIIILVGIAPVKPAEFVIFRIAQVAKGSDIAEA